MIYIFLLCRSGLGTKVSLLGMPSYSTSLIVIVLEEFPKILLKFHQELIVSSLALASGRCLWFWSIRSSPVILYFFLLFLRWVHLVGDFKFFIDLLERCRILGEDKLFVLWLHSLLKFLLQLKRVFAAISLILYLVKIIKDVCLAHWSEMTDLVDLFTRFYSVYL